MKRVMKRVRGLFAPLGVNPGKVRPDYGDERMIRLLAASPVASRAPCLARVREAFERGALAESTALALRHFASRPAPRFFADPRVMLASPHDEVLAQALRSATIEARDVTARGLPVYGRLAPALRPGFPWHDPLNLREDDLLFAVYPHRFGFLPRLALAVAVGGHAHTELGALLDDWMRFAQHEPELTFCSNLVVIQRLLASTWAFAFLGIATEKTAVRWSMLKIVAQDVAFLLPRLGDSYPNNHLLLDRFAGWFIALLLPELLPREAQLAKAEASWISELERQTYDDGGSIEHSTHYHGLASEMGAAYLLLAAANGRVVPPAVSTRIARMLCLQAALSGPDGYAAQIGDSSDDPLFPLDGCAGGNAAALREIHRALFEPERASIADAHPARVRAWWLLDGRLAPKPAFPAKAAVAALNQAGIVVFGEDDEATRCTLRVGPMAGTHYLPGHQHADAMTVTLVRRGVPLLVDAGTYSYRFHATSDVPGAVNWRAYFAGPQAHNGLVVDDRDPLGRMHGDFRPNGRLPEVSPSGSASGRTFSFYEACLDAHGRYPGWARGVVHLSGVALIVYDRLTGAETGTPMHFAFQWAPRCELTHAASAQITALSDGVGVHLAWSEGLGPGEIVCGREHPTNGWVSPAYAERVAAPQLLVRTTGRADLTAFTLVGEETTRGVTVQCEAPSATTRWLRIVTDSAIDIVLLNLGPATRSVEAHGVAFEGRAAWIRVPNAGRPSVRWLEGRACAAPQWSIQYAFSTPVADFDG